jgi:hypothetical protein
VVVWVSLYVFFLQLRKRGMGIKGISKQNEVDAALANVNLAEHGRCSDVGC